MTLSPQLTVIVKVTNSCDMSCQYCFIEPAVYNLTMTSATARKVIRAFLDSDFFQRVHFVWHGGEPLLRSKDFFAQLFAEQTSRPSPVAYTNSIQTNATHLDDEMMDFLIANRVDIGLSLDGTLPQNDRSRRLRQNSSMSAYQVTTKAVQRFRARGLFPGAIVVVNRHNVSEPEAVYQEFKRQRLNMKLNCLTWSGQAVNNGLDLAISPEEYGVFLTRMFDLWFDDPDPVITIEPFKQHIGRILDIEGTAQSCYFSRSCYRFFLGVSPNGDLFPCGLFQGESTFRYGNIHEMAVEDIGSTVLFQRLEAREHNVLHDCAKCAFLDLCYGGCMFHALKNGQDFERKDYYCAAYHRYFAHILRRIHAEITASKCVR